jgi:ribosomal protein S18 acetylase RimI-like enzyme
MADSVIILPAHESHHIPEIKALFLEYAQSLNFSLCFQGFDTELETLPGYYAPPRGALLVAKVGNTYAGCIALRPQEGNICEMKRLFVRNEFRGLQIGRKLAIAILEEGRKLGYEKMRLDTVPVMQSAITLYRSLGFTEIPPYCENPIAGALYMEIKL